MNVPTYVLFIIAPLNLVFNWLFVSDSMDEVESE